MEIRLPMNLTSGLILTSALAQCSIERSCFQSFQQFPFRKLFDARRIPHQNRKRTKFMMEVALNISTGSGPGSPRGQPAWGGGSDRPEDTSLVTGTPVPPRFDILRRATHN
jgi:hypothetical protein